MLVSVIDVSENTYGAIFRPLPERQVAYANVACRAAQARAIALGARYVAAITSQEHADVQAVAHHVDRYCLAARPDTGASDQQEHDERPPVGHVPHLVACGPCRAGAQNRTPAMNWALSSVALSGKPKVRNPLSP